VWNTGLEQRREYRLRRAWINYPQQCRELADAKTDPEFALLKEVPSHCLQQSLKDLDRACRAHGTWNVKFRSKAKWAPSFRLPEGKHMRVQRLSKRWAQVNLPKFGQVRFLWTLTWGGQIRSATLTGDGVHGDWYVSILVEDGILEAKNKPRVAGGGIDRGVVCTGSVRWADARPAIHERL